MSFSPAEKISVEVNLQNHFDDDLHTINERQCQEWLQKWLEKSKSQLPKAASYEVSLRLSSDREIQQLNAQYRQKNQPTDVLAFATLEVNFPQALAAELAREPLYLGDLVISVETAQKQAQQQGHSLETEIAWLASHGLLHLLGWDHPDEASLNQMLSEQEKLLEIVGIVRSDR
ncbi:MAG: rRNA maturation RNase YbeY [Oscillatoria sp. PMC 1051.18]|nr:rRNA maturation RNase YbeY [Oscillatoria sp. PMC 1050.18]MEC5028382.1 rRNA maturation RNase YbeY [Oscillatoria sp. PMC 1051.18]